MNKSSQPDTAALRKLYPFLYGSGRDADATMAEAIKSTIAKGCEVSELRERTVESCSTKLLECAAALADAFVRGGKLLTFGNGGSSTDAQSMASLFLSPPRHAPLAALCLASDVAVITALSNDVGNEVIFLRQVTAFAQANDIAVGISTSGNSRNVVCALDEAHRRGLITVGLAGYDGGAMAQLGNIDFLFVVESASVHRIQETQTTLYHLIWELTQSALARREANHEIRR